MNSMMSQGLQVSALHNHLINENPRLLYMHVNSVEDPMSFARKMRRAMDDFR
jgi:hypothetical protein